MGRGRKKGGNAGAVTNTPAPAAPNVVTLDRAFNDGKGRQDMTDILLDIEETANSFPDDDTVEERDTGYQSQSSESIFRDFIQDLRNTRRDDGTWDVKALEGISRYRGADYGYDYQDGAEGFGRTSAGYAIDDYAKEIRNLINGVRQEIARGGTPTVAGIDKPATRKWQVAGDPDTTFGVTQTLPNGGEVYFGPAFNADGSPSEALFRLIITDGRGRTTQREFRSDNIYDPKKRAYDQNEMRRAANEAAQIAVAAGRLPETVLE